MNQPRLLRAAARGLIRSPSLAVSPVRILSPRSALALHNAVAIKAIGRGPRPRFMSASAAASSGNEVEKEDNESDLYSEAHHEHAVISTFDLFSIGIGPSSSHTVGPMRAGNIFISDLLKADILPRVSKIKVSIYGSLALTGEGHMTPSALLLGLESADVETVDTAYVPARFERIKAEKKLHLGHGLPGTNQGKEIDFDYNVDFKWEWAKKLPMHSNGMRLMVFDEAGDMLAYNDLFSVGGGFVVNGALSTATTAAKQADQGKLQPSTGGLQTEAQGGHPADLAENLFYKEIHREEAVGDRRSGPEVNDAGAIPQGSTGLAEIKQKNEAVATSGDENGEGASTAAKPSYPFHNGRSLLTLCKNNNLTIAQLVYENEKSLGYTDEEIMKKLLRIWDVMDNSILEAVMAPPGSTLPGSLKLHRRAPALYRRLARGLYASHTQPVKDVETRRMEGQQGQISSSTEGSSEATLTSISGTTSLGQRPKGKRGLPHVHGSFYHPIMPSPQRRVALPAMDYLNVYAMAVNETNAAGGRIVTAPTNGAAGIIPAVLKYIVEFISDDPDHDVPVFLLTAAAIGMLYKRGATISAAEGGCMAEVGVACSMAAGAFAACMGATPEVIEQAAEIGIEHNLGLTCDPIGGLVQAPCIERNALGAIKAVSSANLALSGDAGTQKVSLDNAIRAMRLTAREKTPPGLWALSVASDDPPPWDPRSDYSFVMLRNLELDCRFVKDGTLRKKARNGFDKCMRFLGRMGSLWPSVSSMAQNLRKLQDSITTVPATSSQSSRGDGPHESQLSWSINAQLLWDVLIYDKAGRPNASADKSMFDDVVDLESVRHEDVAEFAMVGSAGISGHKSAWKDYRHMHRMTADLILILILGNLLRAAHHSHRLIPWLVDLLFLMNGYSKDLEIWI
ncbi:uncharacterized protein KD926_007966 [Aspergillus affinis]|uniref:uncharacterized protein n=1 Tax=Aspergillus affinis TaxID=1070780 RepID=UPI0022FE66FB|nr:uncharacterized protein KD926_007966 [Aspergillus affinis]KAI9045550.1 hypothetical protein KD926_007966 [Aspergillus affinis]